MKQRDDLPADGGGAGQGNPGGEVRAAESRSFMKKEFASIGRNSLIYVVGQALSRAVGFIMIPVYTKYIAPSGYGAMELIEIIGSSVSILISMGMADGMARFYYACDRQEERNRIVSTIIIGFGAIGLVITLLLLALAGPLSLLIFEEPGYEHFLLISLSTLWFAMFCDIGYNYLRMRYKAKLFVTLTTFQLAMALSLNIYLVVYRRLGILGIFYSTLITEIVVGLGFAFVILARVGPHFSMPILRRLIAFGLPLVPSRIGSMLGFVSNRFFLRYLGSPDPAVALAMVGVFSLGHKFGVVINRFVTVPFNSFWGPRRLELVISGGTGTKETVARVCTYTYIISIWITLVLSAGIQSLLIIMADPSYARAYIVVPFVALSYVALGLETHFSTGILHSRRTHNMTAIGVVSLLVVLVWNYFFVPRWGLYGAATSNLAGFAVRISLIYYVSQRFFHIPFEIRRMARATVTALILFALTRLFSFPSPYTTFLARTGVALLYPLALLGTGFFRPGEREFARETLRTQAVKRNAPAWVRSMTDKL